MECSRKKYTVTPQLHSSHAMRWTRTKPACTKSIYLSLRMNSFSLIYTFCSCVKMLQKRASARGEVKKRETHIAAPRGIWPGDFTTCTWADNRDRLVTLAWKMFAVGGQENFIIISNWPSKALTFLRCQIRSFDSPNNIVPFPIPWPPVPRATTPNFDDSRAFYPVLAWNSFWHAITEQKLNNKTPEREICFEGLAGLLLNCAHTPINRVRIFLTN